MGLPHFFMVRHRVTDAELTAGKEEHATKGQGALKKRTCLTANNLINQVSDNMRVIFQKS
jgi:hypothetical protein